MERFRTVPDTNIIVSSLKNPGEDSPNKEYLDLWMQDKLDLLYSDDTFSEYIEKLLVHKVSESDIKELIVALAELGKHILIETFHLPVYPLDPDDIAFVLCADNGDATHLMSYDRDLLDIKYNFRFKICKIIDFLKDYRKSTKS